MRVVPGLQCWEQSTTSLESNQKAIKKQSTIYMKKQPYRLLIAF